ncbi:MAG: hypothetical protein ACKPBA_11775 [Planctomycetota bacterium]
MSGPEAADREWQRRRRRPYLWTAGAVALSLALVGVAWWVDRSRPEARAPGKVRQRPVAELVTPSPLSEQERSGTGPAFGSQESVRLEQGAWIQVADAAGNLKQQYTATRIDPLPDKRLDMADPRAVLYGEGGRIVTMRADSMAARVPKRALESGRLAGNVVIRIFRPRDGRPVDLKVDQPDVTVESPEADFDSESGEIRCDRQVRISGEVITFDGEGLSLTLSQDGKNLERLVVDRALAPVRISRAAVEAQAKRREADAVNAPPAAPPAAAPAPAAAAPGAVASGAVASGKANARGGKRTGTGGAAAGASAPAGPRLFQLTMHDGVEIVSNEEERRTTVRGSRVDAFFMLKGGSGMSLAARDPFGPPSRPLPAVAVAGPPARAVAALALGAVAQDDEDVVTVTFGGKLVMAPAPEGTPALGAPDAVRMVVTGSPATVVDSLSEARIEAATATFETKVDRVELVGTVDEPASVETPDFTLGARHFTLDRAAGRGASDGPGTIVMGGAGSKPLVVSWGTGMTLALEPGTGDAEGTFRGAEFVGDVDARSPDFEMQSGRLAVEARPVGTKDVPRRILATGGVRARALGSGKGTFSAQSVDIALSPNAEGEAQPRTLVATGGVAAGDDAQSLWCTTLRTTFIPRAAGSGAAGGVGSDLGEVVAEGPVELRMQDGGRAFASRLEADGAGRSARLFGPDVMVVRGNLVLDQLAEVRVQEAPVRVSALGPGRASGFRDPVIAATDGAAGPVGRPRIGGLPQMQATWRDSLAFADGAVKGTSGEPDRGLLLLQGGVKVRASREPREAEALDAQEVEIETLPRTAQAGRTGAGDAQSVGQMRAKGEVRLEARQWADGRRQGDPRLFRLNAPNIAYDGRDGSAFVDGAGSLLVFDPPPVVGPERADDPKSPFSPHGTTRFAWKRSLSMERRPDNTSSITLEREVVMDHLGNSSEATGTVSADRMMATVRGLDGAKPAAGTGDVAMSLGGAAELTRIAADGRVVVRTSELDVEAGEFELDVPSQIGAARAEVGRLFTVIQRGRASPLRGHAFRWDLVKGTLSVEGARGVVGR